MDPELVEGPATPVPEPVEGSTCCDRLIETRLQTETLSSSCGSVISVQRFERWIVPVLLLSARLLIVSFQVSHGWLVVWRLIRMSLNCERAAIFLNILM